MLMVNSSPKINPEAVEETLLDSGWQIVLYNDEVNSFDWVIVNLMKYCNHNRLQAEQCAWFVHNNGKYAVKNGGYDYLAPVCTALCEKVCRLNSRCSKFETL